MPKTSRVSSRGATARGSPRAIASPRGMASVTSAKKLVPNSPRSPGRGGKNFKPNFEQPSAAKDVVDPIYENKDPISASIKIRMEAGSLMSVQRSGKRAEPFFFGMELVGPGLDIQSPAEVKAKAKKAEK